MALSPNDKIEDIFKFPEQRRGLEIILGGLITVVYYQEQRLRELEGKGFQTQSEFTQYTNEMLKKVMKERGYN